MSQSHNARVLEILKRGGSITQFEASRWDDPCLRLSARIQDLRDGIYDGIKYDIETIKEPNADGKGKHGRYRLKLYSAPGSAPYSIITPKAPADPKTLETVARINAIPARKDKSQVASTNQLL